MVVPPIRLRASASPPTPLRRPRVKTIHERNEELQAHCLHRQLALLDSAGVDGAFVFTYYASH
jgi:hypothetical protein